MPVNVCSELASMHVNSLLDMKVPKGHQAHSSVPPPWMLRVWVWGEPPLRSTAKGVLHAFTKYLVASLCAPQFSLPHLRPRTHSILLGRKRSSPPLGSTPWERCADTQNLVPASHRPQPP